MKTALCLTVAAFVLTAVKLSAATHYVSLESTNPVPPYTNWVTAATTIQDAVDVAATNDVVLVTNGVYAVGGRETFDNHVNSLGFHRVAITNPISLRSVNGPQVTAIDGGGWAQCIFLADRASLTGFTLTNGWSQIPGGGVSGTSTNAFLTNCVIVGNSVGGYWPLSGWPPAGGDGGGAAYCTLYSCTIVGNSAHGWQGWSGVGLWYDPGVGGGVRDCALYNCTLTGNSASEGGGAYSSTLNNCALSDNSAGDGGGAYSSTLNNCALSDNSASCHGGASGCTLYNCTLTGNSATSGAAGGASGCTLYNCTLTSNSAEWPGGGADSCELYNCTLSGNSADEGGGASFCTLYNCTVSGNSAQLDGGGASFCTLYNCTVSGNSATNTGGGAYWSTLNNCIIYHNSATNGANYSWDEYSSFVHCCTTPMPTNGVGNITNAPLFVNAAEGDFRLLPDSPCIDAGTNLTGIITNDILDLPRPMDGNGDGIAGFDIGAYEFNPYRFAPTLYLSGSGLQFTVYGEPNRSVRIERSRDVVNWEHLTTVPVPIGGQTLIDHAATSEPRLFYRAMRVP